MSEWNITYDDPNVHVRACNKHLHEFAMQILLHRPSCYHHGEFDPSEEQATSAYELAITILTVGSEHEYTLYERGQKYTPYEGIEAFRAKHKQQQGEVKP